MRKLIEVTRKDIRQGKRWASRSCPVALAIQRQTGEDCLVKNACIVAQGKFLPIKSPRSVSRFVRRFDAGKRCQPFRFYLKYP